MRSVCLASLIVGAMFSPAALADGFTITPVRTSDAEFGRPHDVAITEDGANLYVADLDNNRIQILDPGNLRVIGTFGANDLAAPHDVAFDSKGRVLVADTGNDRVAVYEVKVFKYETRATLIESWNADGNMGKPEGVAEGPDGRVYVSNAGLGTVLALRDGVVVAQAGDTGPSDTHLRRPHDVHVSPDGQVYVVDSGNHRIMIYDADLNLVGQLTHADYGFKEPKYLAFADDGRLLIADEYNHRVLVLDQQHRVIGQIGTGEQGDGPDQLNKPEGVDIAGRYVWIADKHNHQIRLYRIGTLN